MREVNGFAIFVQGTRCTIALVISEAVFYADDDPVSVIVSVTGSHGRTAGVGGGELSAYHRFVKTTPNPRATKNNSGELVGPPLPVSVPEVVDDGALEVVDDMAVASGGAVSCEAHSSGARLTGHSGGAGA